MRPEMTFGDYLFFAFALYGMVRFVVSSACFFCNLATTAKDVREAGK